ncbi:hypothetical protein IHE44_0008834 [Lamprotornis superbus]|uniref:Uncharacterized protein n=1 Tax=Lamprotornis superbus TaxID=245042 RepID=A0A835NMA6_9PASS|nr:hypothetical protein IHE44_0008834 [Lamprotornis superbus]
MSCRFDLRLPQRMNANKDIQTHVEEISLKVLPEEIHYRKSKMDALHKLKILVMFLSLATFTVMVIMNAGNATGTFKGLFRTTPGNISAKYSTDFTPAGWTFLIWNVIYTWQLAWLLYALSGICRRYLLPALVFLAVLSLTTCASLFVSHRALSIHSSWFVKGHKVELWLIRILVQNGLALYLTWTSIATLLNFAVVLIYKWNVTDEKATTASLSILALGLVVWFYLENYFLDKYVRYNLTVYPVVIAALTGSTCRNRSFSSPLTNDVFIVVLLTLTCLIFAVRLGLVTWRHWKRPLEASESRVTRSYLVPATWTQEFGVLAAILTQTFPHLAAVEDSAGSSSVMVRADGRLGSGQPPFDTSHQQQLAPGRAPRTSSCPQPLDTAPPCDALGYRAQAESRLPKNRAPRQRRRTPSLRPGVHLTKR